MLRGRTVHFTMKKGELSFEIHKKSARSSLGKTIKKMVSV
jgi:hypothetical protein